MYMYSAVHAVQYIYVYVQCGTRRTVYMSMYTHVVQCGTRRTVYMSMYRKE